MAKSQFPDVSFCSYSRSVFLSSPVSWSPLLALHQRLARVALPCTTVFKGDKETPFLQKMSLVMKVSLNY